MPSSSFWKPSMADIACDQVDPVLSGKFRIRPGDRVVTAGSCFAQHIARHLRARGFGFLVTEQANPIIPELLVAQYNYGVFSARYGNVYTATQLKQLLARAYGLFQPMEDIWPAGDGRFIDPFRPQIQPDGFASRAEFDADRKQHFAAVRRAVEELDVFVFTLGLTESWVCRADGAVFPLCPGVAGGTYDPARHAFVNQTVRQVTDDLRDAIEFIRARNPRACVILTVSPVPLVATAEDRSVLVSTTYSKSVLRVAAEEVSRDDRLIAYFPSYEIITGNHARGRYFADDLRSVTEEGVEHVMALFAKHYLLNDGRPADAPVAVLDADRAAEEERRRAVSATVRVICDEEALDPGRSA